VNKQTLWLVLIVIGINAIFNGIFQLHYDESYYWVWGQNLSLSYYDHPPLIAYLIRLAIMLGNSEFFVRLPALVTTTITLFIVYTMAKKIFDEKVANIAILLAIACPIIEAVFFVVTPDSPLLMFWALTLYCFYIGIFEDKVKYIYLAGIFSGGALLSKYTAVLIFPSLFMFLITSKRHWQYLLRKDVYLAFILALLIASPVIIWNYEHGWVSFLFQLHHGMDSTRIFNLDLFFEYWGSQFLVGGPILFCAIMYYLIRYFKTNLGNDKLAFLVWPLIFTLGFFGYYGLFKHMEGNWPSPAYLSGFIFLAYWLNKFENRWIYRSSLIFIFIVIIAVKFPTVFAPQRFHNRIPTMNIFYGNKEMLAKVVPYLTPGTVVLGCDYGNASRAWYYLHLKRTYVLDSFPFAHAYNYWDTRLTLPIKSAIYICDTNDLENLIILTQYFKSIRLVDVATYSNVIADNKTYIYKLYN